MNVVVRAGLHQQVYCCAEADFHCATPSPCSPQPSMQLLLTDRTR
jgi:hypothetical protein